MQQEKQQFLYEVRFVEIVGGETLPSVAQKRGPFMVRAADSATAIRRAIKRNAFDAKEVSNSSATRIDEAHEKRGTVSFGGGNSKTRIG